MSKNVKIWENVAMLAHTQKEINAAQSLLQELSGVFSKVSEIPKPESIQEFSEVIPDPERWIKNKIAQRMREDQTAKVGGLLMNPEKAVQMIDIPSLPEIKHLCSSLQKYIHYIGIFDFSTLEPDKVQLEGIKSQFVRFTNDKAIIEAYEAHFEAEKALNKMKVCLSALNLNNLNRYFNFDGQTITAKKEIWQYVGGGFGMI